MTLKDFPPCGKVDAYEFVRSCATKGSLRGSDPLELARLRKTYRHLEECDCYTYAVAGAFEEFAIGNSKFPTRLFHENLAHLEDSGDR